MMHLDQELDHLNQILLKMADVVQKNLIEAFDAYKDGQNPDELIVNDDIVDQYERLVEEICLNIMVKERLYARDLRIVTGILKLVADLERIGDHAEDIMEYNLKYIKCGQVKIEGVDEIVNVALSMVNDSIMSFVKGDLDLARDVIKRDDIVDEGYDKLINYVIEEMNERNMSPSLGIYTTAVIKYIERISDHAVNIAEWVIYIVSGYHKDKQIF
jgi:phosphate transport system protein